MRRGFSPWKVLRPSQCKDVELGLLGGGRVYWGNRVHWVGANPQHAENWPSGPPRLKSKLKTRQDEEHEDLFNLAITARTFLRLEQRWAELRTAVGGD